MRGSGRMTKPTVRVRASLFAFLGAGTRHASCNMCGVIVFFPLVTQSCLWDLDLALLQALLPGVSAASLAKSSSSSGFGTR